MNFKGNTNFCDSYQSFNFAPFIELEAHGGRDYSHLQNYSSGILESITNSCSLGPSKGEVVQYRLYFFDLILSLPLSELNKGTQVHGYTER